MAGLIPATCIALLALVNEVYAPTSGAIVLTEPTCSQGMGPFGPNIVCTAGTDNNYILKKSLVSDSKWTTEIILKDCGITKIENDSFSALPALQNLDLSNNKVNVLDEVFKETSSLRNLNLSNSLQVIKPHVFDPLTKLVSLDLSNNVGIFVSLDSKTFEQNRNLEYLDLSGSYRQPGIEENLLQTSVKTMKTLKLNSCWLREVPSFVTQPNMESLVRLELSSNQVTKMDNPKTFSNLINLEFLSLDGNLIESIHEDVFKDLKNLKGISLHNNKITQLPETLFTNLRKLGNVNLSHNLIKYIPVNAFRNTNIKNLNLADNKFTYLQDNFCLELRNSGVRLKKFFFNQNPWQCACLNDVLVEVKKLGIEYNGAKYNGKEPVCVTTKEFNCKRQPNFNEEYSEFYNDIINKN